jgi:hypothetical protein
MSAALIVQMIKNKAGRTQLAKYVAEMSLGLTSREARDIAGSLLECDYPPLEDPVNKILAETWKKESGDYASDGLETDLIPLFARVSLATRRHSLQISPEKLKSFLRYLVSNQEISLSDTIDFVTAYTFHMEKPQLNKEIKQLFTQIESRLRLENISGWRLYRLAEAVVKFDSIDYAILDEIANKIALSGMEGFDHTLFLAFYGFYSRYDYFNEQFVTSVRSSILAKNTSEVVPINASQDSLLSSSDKPFTGHHLQLLFNHLPKYASILDTDLNVTSHLCSLAMPFLNTLSEPMLVNILIGLHRRRPQSLTPEMEVLIESYKKLILDFSPGGIATGVSLITKLQSTEADLEFVDTALNKIMHSEKAGLNIPHFQQLFAIISHNKNRFIYKDKYIEYLISQFKSNSYGLQAAHVVTLLAAFMNLQIRDIPSMSIFVNTLLGRGVKEPIDFNDSSQSLSDMDILRGTQRCLYTLTPADNTVQGPHLACIVAAMEDLEVTRCKEVVLLLLVIRGLLIRTGLHNLKANSISGLISCYARLDVDEKTVKKVEAKITEYFEKKSDERFRYEPDRFVTMEEFRSKLIENLKRHEPYITSNWPVLSRLKVAILAGELNFEKDEFLQKILSLEKPMKRRQRSSVTDDQQEETGEEEESEDEEETGVVVSNSEEVAVTTASSDSSLLSHLNRSIEENAVLQNGFRVSLLLKSCPS